MLKLLQLRLLSVAVLLLGASALFGQYTVSGNIQDAGGEPLIGVNILVRGTSSGTVTDFDGNFSLSIPNETATLILTYTGFRTQEIQVDRNSTNLAIVLDEDVTGLDEVVVTGLASNIKRSNLANAVSTVSAEELTGVTSQQTVDGALYGKLTGVNIIQTTGAPGGGYAVRLRGVSSLSGNNQPLYIVDGVYIDNSETPNGSRFASGANSGSEEGSSNRIADINPDDIQSIEVLKGASAAAIYGTRANAGVVIITTKKGKAGETNISLNQDFGFNTIIRKVGVREYTAAGVEELFGAAERVIFEEAQRNGQIFDYEDEVYGNLGLISDTRLRVSGGNDKTLFFVSGSYRDEDGIVENTGYERLTARINLEHKISKMITITANSNYIKSTSNRSFTGNENDGGLSLGYNLAYTRPWRNLFPDENGVFPDNPNANGNPLYNIARTRNEENINRFLQGVGLNIRLLQTDNQALKLVANGGLDFYLNETEVYVPEDQQGQRGRQNGFLGIGNATNLNFNYNTLLVHDYYTESGINFTTQGGVSYLNFDRNSIFNQSTQLIPLQTTLDQAGAQSSAQTRSSLEEFGLILQEEINVQDKVILTGGIRADKSSLNGDPNKYFLFPRASVALNLNNFDFFQTDLFQQFKLRAAYGQTGNSADFGSLFTSLGVTNIDGNAGFSVLGTQGRSDLEPETSTELEFGADFTLVDGKVGFTATYYIRDVEDLLYQRSLPTSTGFSSEIRNDLDLRNRGLELSLNINPIRTPNFNWTATFNYWYNRSEITRLGIPDGSDGEDIPSFVPPGVAFGLGLGTFYINEGSPITGLWNNVDGVPTQTGDTEPDFQFSWMNSFNIVKNLDINFLMHLRAGGEGLNLSRLLTDDGGTTPAEFDDRMGYIEDNSYLRLRELGIYYRIPTQSNFLKSTRVGVSARNLFTITDYSSYDPETSTKGGGGLSQSIEVAPFPSSKQFYLHLGLNF